MSNPSGSLKAIVFALGANAAIACAKLFAALYTGSQSMLAEAVHSFADCANQGLLLIGLKQARRPPSPEYPLGHGKVIYFWSFLVALLLFGLGGVFSIYEGVHKFSSAEALNSPGLAILILIFSIVMEAFSLRACVESINAVRGERGFWRWFRETRQSELLVVFGEDIAALTGLVLALAAIGLAIITGNPRFDALGSVVIGILLCFVAAGIANEVKGLLVGQSVDRQEEQAIRQLLERQPSVRKVLQLVSQQLGSDALIVARVQFAGHGDSFAIGAAKDCEKAVQAAFPQVRWVFVAPGIPEQDD